MPGSTLALRGIKIGRLAARSSIIVMGSMTVMVVALVWVVSANLATIRAAGDQVQHSAAVEIAAANVLTAAVDQETGIRGFAETGNRAFLAPFTTGDADYRAALASLRALTQDNPGQARQIAKVDQAMTDWRDVYAKPQLTGSADEQSRTEVAQAGKIAMDGVRLRLGEVRSEEARLARERSSARDRAYATAYATLYGVGGLVLILGLGLGVWALALLARGEREARDHAEAKTRILAFVSHEIRTPLNGVLGMLQAMAADPLPEAQSDRVALALEAGQTLTTLLNDLLDASKIEAGRLELVEAEFDLERLLAGIHGVFKPLAQGKGVALRLDIATDALGPWIGDRVRLGQIVTNLVSNAVKFTSAGEVRIRAEAADPGLLTVSVTDSGIGMDNDTVERLFSPFTQADAQTAHRFGGTGLGLSISRALARLMGGDIKVSSVAGHGSTFTVQLPLARGAAGAGSEGAASSLDGLRVLAADDNATNRQVLAAVLPSLGMQVTLVDGGEAAVAAWQAGSFDTVLLDLRMPDCDGFEVARRIRALEGAGTRTPLILLSGDVTADIRAEGIRAGLDRFVAKPLEIHALAEAIVQSLRDPRVRQAA